MNVKKKISMVLLGDFQIVLKHETGLSLKLNRNLSYCKCKIIELAAIDNP